MKNLIAIIVLIISVVTGVSSAKAVARIETHSEYQSALTKAKSGDSDSMLLVAYYLNKPETIQQSLEWMNKAAELNNAEAQLSYTVMLADLKKHQDAIYYMRRYMARGNIFMLASAWPMIFRNLPEVYQTPELRDELVIYIKKSCNAKIYTACYVLRDIYKNGEAGIKVDDVEASQWHDKVPSDKKVPMWTGS